MKFIFQSHTTIINYYCTVQPQPNHKKRFEIIKTFQILYISPGAKTLQFECYLLKRILTTFYVFSLFAFYPFTRIPVAIVSLPPGHDAQLTSTLVPRDVSKAFPHQTLESILLTKLSASSTQRKIL